MTIDEIYAAINPLPAKLNGKGKVRPEVYFKIEANAGVTLTLSWKKPYSNNDWEHDYQCFTGGTFTEVFDKAISHIHDMPSAEQAKLHHFMGKLGKLIDAGKDDGIEVAYLNPLIESMRKLSENVITHQPAKKRRGVTVASHHHSTTGE